MDPITHRASDTSAEAATTQAAIHRRMTGVERLRIAIDMSLAAREFALARLRAEHPGWDEDRVAAALIRLIYGLSPSAPR